MNHKIKKLREELLKEARERDKKIVQEAILGERAYWEIAKKYGISTERVRQILRKFRIKVPLEKGMPKYKRWIKRISKSKTGLKYQKQ